MWVLEAETLDGRYWLRPGEKYTLGRSPQSRIQVGSKTVSKLHVTILVSNVPEGAVSDLDVRSTVSITDHDSKFGTWLDGRDIKNKTVEMSSTEHTIRVAKMPQVMRLSWQPIVITSAGGRAIKIKQLAAKLEPFDIKLVKDYNDQTTYVMSSKTNTAKGLAALIHSKYIVTELFADSLASNLASIGDILEPDSLPDPMEFLPPTEEYSPDLFRPNPARAEIFKGLTFIFLDEGQYNNLVLPINSGQGKALEFNPTGKRVEALVKYASNKGQVVLVQRNVEEDDLCVGAAKSLGFEPITQSDFLAPVLRVDRTLIVKPLDVTMQTTPSTPTVGRASQSSPTTPVEEQAPTVIPDSAERPDNTQVDTQMNESPKQVVDIVSPTPVKRKIKPRPRTAANSQIDFFDDFFTKSAPKTASQVKQSPRKRSTSKPENDPFVELTSPRKPIPVVLEPEEEDDFAPAATEMRKHLAATGSQNSIISDESDAPSTTTTKSKVKNKKRAAPEDDEVIAAARERKRVAREASRIAAEELAQAVQGHEHLRNLGKVETFHVDLTARSSRRDDRSTRWDPTWNGRKNFKKFRRAKQSVSLGVGKNVIQLVDYKGVSAASQSQDFFAVPRRLRQETPEFPVHRGEPSSDDFAIEMSPATTHRRGAPVRKGMNKAKETPSSSNRSGGGLFVRDDDSDNSLDFDSS